jgi:hypothetical protein
MAIVEHRYLHKGDPTVGQQFAPLAKSLSQNPCAAVGDDRARKVK